MVILGGLLFLWPAIMLYVLRANCQSCSRLRLAAESITIWGTGILLCTELLSRFGGFARIPVTIAFALAGGALTVVAVRINAFKFARPRIAHPMLAGLLAVPCLTTLIVSLVSAPNNLDSQVYHLPRVLQWVQAGSVDHFVTGSIWQTGYPPFGEYLVANLYLLVGSDQLAGLPQWIAPARGSNWGLAGLRPPQKPLARQAHLTPVRHVRPPSSHVARRPVFTVSSR